MLLIVCMVNIIGYALGVSKLDAEFLVGLFYIDGRFCCLVVMEVCETGLGGYGRT